MSVSRTGSVVEINTTNENSSQSVTVPSDAEIMVLGCAGYEPGANLFGSGASFSIGGSALTLAIDGGVNVNTMQTALWYKVSPSTGSQTFAWNCVGAVTPDYGFHFWIAFYKGINTGTPIGSTGYEQDTGGGDSTTGTLTIVSGDAIFAVMNAWETGYNITWTNATELTETEYNGERSGVAEAFPASNTAVSVSGTSSNKAISGMVIKASSATASVSGTITSGTYEADIVSGGKTIVIELTGDTWIGTT